MTLFPSANISATRREASRGMLFKNRLEMRARKSGWKILGAGVDGVVFDNGKMIRKFTEVENRSEYNALKNLANSGYVPKVHQMNMGKGYTMYSMNRLPPNTETLRRWYARHLTSADMIGPKKMLAKIVEDMHDRGISHGDLHDENIMVTLDDKDQIKKMWLIDFGRSIRIPHGKTELESYKSLKTTKSKTYGILYGPSVRYSRPNIKLTKVPLGNFKRGLTTLDNQGRKVYVGPSGRRFRLENGKKVPVKRTIAVRPVTPPKSPSPLKAPSPMRFETNGLGRRIYVGPRGGLYVMQNGKKLKPAKGRALAPRAKTPPKAPSPKAPSPKAPSPKAPSPKAPSPKAPSPKAPSPKAPSPKAPRGKPKAGDLNSKGRLIHAGPKGGLYVIHNGKKIYKK